MEKNKEALTKYLDEFYSNELHDSVRKFLEETVDFQHQPNESAKDAFIYNLIKIITRENIKALDQSVEVVDVDINNSNETLEDLIEIAENAIAETHDIDAGDNTYAANVIQAIHDNGYKIIKKCE
jgi:hypothetical protein